MPYTTLLRGRFIRFAVALLFLLPMQGGSPASAPAISPDNGLFVSAPGRADMVFDEAQHLLYVSAGDQVLRYDVGAGTFLTPWTIAGANLKGMDLSPDGKTIAIADLTCEGSFNQVHFADLETGTISKAQFPLAFGEAGTWSVAFGSDGRLLVSSTYNGSGWVPLRRYDPATGDTATIASVCMKTMLCASADRSVIGWAEANNSAGPVGRYVVATENVRTARGYDTSTAGYNFEIATNNDGTRFFVPIYNNNWVFDGELNRVRSWVNRTNGGAYHPRRNVLFAAPTYLAELWVYDMDALALIARRPIGKTFDWVGNWGFNEGRVKVSHDGRYVFATVDDGVWLSTTSFLRFEDEYPGEPLPASPVVTTWGPADSQRVIHSFEMSAGASFEATLTPADGVDVDIALYPPTKTAVSDSVSEEASSAVDGLGEVESLRYVAPASATYYLASTCATGSGETTLTYQITPGISANADDDIPGIELLGSINGASDEGSDKWDVYRARLARRSSLAVTVTPDVSLDMDLMMFTDPKANVAFHSPTISVANGGFGAQESMRFDATTTADYFIAVRASAGSGEYHLESTFAAPPPLATSIEVTCTSDGVQAMVSGKLRDSEGSAVQAAPMTIESSQDGTSWAAATDATTTSSGTFSATIPIVRNTSFRVSYAGQDGAYLSSVSDSVGAVRSATVIWAKAPPSKANAGQKFSIKTTLGPGHADSACVGQYRFERLQNGMWVERLSVPVTGRRNATTGLMEFPLYTSVPFSGSWRVSLDAGADAAHGAKRSDTRSVQVGLTTLSISAKTTVALGSPVTISGWLKNSATGNGITGKYVKVYWSKDNNNWSHYATVKTGTGGKLTYTARPGYKCYYRFVFAGDSKWQPKTSSSKAISTIFTTSGRTAGHFTTKKVYLSKGNRKLYVRIDARGQSVYLHSQDESQKLLLANAPGVYSGYVEVASPGYVHFRVIGNGYYKIQVWN